jgi:hypothetical protein
MVFIATDRQLPLQDVIRVGYPHIKSSSNAIPFFFSLGPSSLSSSSSSSAPVNKLSYERATFSASLCLALSASSFFYSPCHPIKPPSKCILAKAHLFECRSLSLGRLNLDTFHFLLLVVYISHDLGLGQPIHDRVHAFRNMHYRE